MTEHLLPDEQAHEKMVKAAREFYYYTDDLLYGELDNAAEQQEVVFQWMAAFALRAQHTSNLEFAAGELEKLCKAVCWRCRTNEPWPHRIDRPDLHCDMGCSARSIHQRIAELRKQAESQKKEK